MFLGDLGRTQRRQLLRDLRRTASRYAEGAAKIVWIDLATGRSTPLPEASSPRRCARRRATGGDPSRVRRGDPGTHASRHDHDRPALAAVPGAHRRRQPHRVRRAGRRGDRRAAARLRVAVALVGRATRRRSGARVWDFAGVVGERGARTLVDGDRMPGARWFPDARLNFAENLLRRRAAEPRARGAGVPRRGQGRRRADRRASCWRWCRALAQALRRAGVGAGDRVAAYLPNMPEAIVAMLAAVEPRRDLVVVLAGLRRRRACSTASARSSRRCSSPSTATGTTARRCRSSTRSPRSPPRLPSRRARRRRAVPAAERRAVRRPCRDARRRRAATRSSRRIAARPIAFARLPFDHPLYILYSSGTTGVPKCIVHGAGGTLLQHLKEHQLHTDVKPRRPAVLLHHLRLDDVELAGLAASPPARRCCSTTARRSSRAARCCGTSPSASG